MAVTDLDGTLLNDNQQVSREDYHTLLDLGEKGVLRVIATGRSPFSFKRLISADFPIDYLVFSSGAGIMDYHTGEIIFSINLPEKQVHQIAIRLKDMGVPFKVLGAVPENHHYVYYQNGELHPDFIRRMENYRGYETPISFDPPNFGVASQFLIILPADPARFEELKSMFTGVKVIRATSPIDHESIWMEIFHQDVSKSKAVAELCRMHQIDPSKVMGIGNDYNDMDLLTFPGFPFVVANAPEELKSLYRQVADNNHSGFTEAVNRSFLS
ncbi:MAG: HAD family hydrolase [Bacteroidales bacterium]|nr:HAD family hydrolase [Bacteroidales bacterium]